MSETKYKRPVHVRYTVTADDASATEASIQLDKNPTVLKDWYMSLPYVRATDGTVKTGFTWTYSISGSSAGYLVVANDTDTLAKDDLIDLSGSLNLY